MDETAQPAFTPPAARLGAGVVLAVKALVCVSAGLMIAESFWRSSGYLPAKSDMILFARLRKSVDHDADAVALIGSSRIRCGLNPATLQATVPDRRFVQLGILGNSGIPVLEDLARDESFRGLVICEFHVSHWLLGDYPASKAPPPLSFTRPTVSGAYLETWLGEQLRERFSFIAYNLFTEAPRMLQHRRIPEPEHADRFLPVYDLGPRLNEDQSRVWEKVAREQETAIKKTTTPSHIPGAVPGLVEAIRRRGGNVAFVRMPVDGRLRLQEETAFPQTATLMRELRASGIEVVDFADLPTHFRCPDGSHLEVGEAARFSQTLAGILGARGFFTVAPGRPSSRTSGKGAGLTATMGR